eukprot:SAG25_NODE_1104_length_3966_cov_11.231446_1_plen_251_part_10
MPAEEPIPAEPTAEMNLPALRKHRDQHPHYYGKVREGGQVGKQQRLLQLLLKAHENKPNDSWSKQRLAKKAGIEKFGKRSVEDLLTVIANKERGAAITKSQEVLRQATPPAPKTAAAEQPEDNKKALDTPEGLLAHVTTQSLMKQLREADDRADAAEARAKAAEAKVAELEAALATYKAYQFIKSYLDDEGYEGEQAVTWEELDRITLQVERHITLQVEFPDIAYMPDIHPESSYQALKRAKNTMVRLVND